MTTQLETRINTIINDQLVDRHSFFQLQYFVIGKEPTLQAKLWRCLQEIHSRQEQLAAISLEIEETEDRILIYKEEVENLSVNNSDFRTKIKCRQFQRRLQSSENTLVSLRRKLSMIQDEKNFFIQAFEVLENKEPLKPYDDLGSQKEYWNEKLHKEMQLKILLNQPLSTELVGTIMALPADCKIKKETEQLLDDIQKISMEKNDRKSIECR